ncbi:hypothetical protein U1872_21890 [Sphingomonas sp. RB3P16]|uniref:hypothetical protein n=1 Tax=Parasphingomonas frigoris TaxID=3096163 RepID=UPI002FC9BFB7
MIILNDNDGLPFSDAKFAPVDGLEVGLAKRLMASVGEHFIMPSSGTKAVELRLAVEQA